jgi:hypothetical protein
VTPFARKRVQQHEHRTPRRLRPQPGLELPTHDDRRHHPRRTGRSGPRVLTRSLRFSTARHHACETRTSVPGSRIDARGKPYQGTSGPHRRNGPPIARDPPSKSHGSVPSGQDVHDADPASFLSVYDHSNLLLFPNTSCCWYEAFLPRPAGMESTSITRRFRSMIQ